MGVTSEPDCTVIELTPHDKFIVLASDGVWEFIESQEAIEIVGNCDTVEEGCRQVRGGSWTWLVVLAGGCKDCLLHGIGHAV